MVAREDGGLRLQRSSPQGGEPAPGTLYLVGTPIGNLDDMSWRAVHILKEATWIAAEDTRRTRKLLTHFDISGKLVSYHEHNRRESGKALLEKLRAGDSVALVSDAGMPAVSDPGAELAAAAIDEGFAVVPVPGPNAALTALIASGLPTNAFVFLGFLPREKKKAIEELGKWRRVQATILFYEAPHRLAATLRVLLKEWGDRPCVLARELTKRYEEFARGTLSSCLAHVECEGAKGEYVVVVGGADDADDVPNEEASQPWWSGLTVAEHVAAYETKEGLDRKEALKRAAGDRNVPKRELYDQLHRGRS